MKTRYEYEIRTKCADKYLERAFVREDARKIKSEWKDAGFDVKIIQRIYTLVEEKVVR